MGDRNNMHSVKVDGISESTTSDSLRDGFKKFGEVGDCYVPRDRDSGMNRGFAFVRFFDQSAIGAAISEMDNKEFEGSVIGVHEAQARRERDNMDGGGGGRWTWRVLRLPERALHPRGQLPIQPWAEW